MKAMILAAGFGTRMRPLTDTCPKPLLKVGGKPLIDYHLEKLVAAGVQDVVVNSAWLSEQIVDYLGKGERYGLRIAHSVESEALETAGGIIRALPLLGGSPFLLINGDVWTDLDLQPLLKLNPAGVHLLLTNNPAHHPHGDFAVGADGALLAASQNLPSHTYMGVSVWNPAVFGTYPDGKRALRPVIDRLIEEGTATAALHSGEWWDVGTPERLAELDEKLTAS